METTLRNAELDQLIELLRTQQDAKIDLVTPTDQLRFADGQIRVPLDNPIMNATGVITELTLDPSDEMIGDIATRADIPVRYLRKLYANDDAQEDFAEWRELLDQTLTTHYHDAAMNRKVLIRAFHNEEGAGTGRALLSDRYRAIDNLDILMATLTGVKSSGVNATVTQCNLSPRSMRVRFTAPEITAMAPELLDGYRTPWENKDGGGYGTQGLRDDQGNLPIVYAGFEISNSEIGSGTAKITPIINVRICNNGLVINAAAQAHRHTGGKLDTGMVNWSAGTQQKAVDLITSQTTDIVGQFLTVDFLQDQITGLTAKAGKPVDDPKGTIERIGKNLSWSEKEQDQILAMFIRGGQSTSGGVMQAVTAAAQIVEDPDRAWDIEAQGIRAMELV